MNALKMVVILGVLGAVSYGVYSAITNNPQLVPPPTEMASPWDDETVGQDTPPGDPVETYPRPDVAASPLSGGSTYDSPGQPRGNLDQPSSNPLDDGGAISRSIDLPPSPDAAMVEPSGLIGSQSDPATYDQRMASFRVFMQDVHQRLGHSRNELLPALSEMSYFHNRQDLPPEAQRELIEVMSKVAGSLIYSTEHLLERAYPVRDGDTLAAIATTYKVPPQILARINGIVDPNRLQPGTYLKVLQGPFDAEVRLDTFELTLKLHGLYAGRFPVGVGDDYPNCEGDYVVVQKTIDPSYAGPNVSIPSNAPNNPLGERMICLKLESSNHDTAGPSLHGAPDPTAIGRNGGLGSIRLSNRDVDDLYGILSVGSRVKIMRR